MPIIAGKDDPAPAPAPAPPTERTRLYDRTALAESGFTHLFEDVNGRDRDSAFDDDDIDDDKTTRNTSSNHHHIGTPPTPSRLLRRRHSRSESGGSVLEMALESVLDVKDAIKEGMEDVQEAIVEGMDHVKEIVTEGMDEIKEVLHEPVAEPVQPRDAGDHSRKLNAIALAVIVFYKVSGGPFGCEPTVQAAGPLGAIVGFILFPILWCIPEALVTAELGSAYPEPSGAIAWVEEAFGSKAGLLCGYFHYISGATDNAIYPSLLLEYIAAYYAMDDDYWYENPWLRFGLAVAITTILSFVNYTGLEIVGKVSIVVCIVSMSPFIMLCIMGLPRLQPRRWLVQSKDPIEWRLLLNNLFWNLNSFDAGANFAGEVQDPATVFPRAMFLSIFLVVISYLLPLLAALGATEPDQEAWVAGYFTTVSTAIAGPWLGMWLVFAAAVSNIALFEAELSGDSYCLLGMADRGLIPKVFTKRDAHFDTPVNGIILGTFIIIALSVANFEQLVEMLNFAYSLSLLMELAAFVKLRISHAHGTLFFGVCVCVCVCVFQDYMLYYAQ
jgi:amino acid transporter